jgi:hypothetical protein
LNSSRLATPRVTNNPEGDKEETIMDRTAKILLAAIALV